MTSPASGIEVLLDVPMANYLALALGQSFFVPLVSFSLRMESVDVTVSEPWKGAKK